MATLEFGKAGRFNIPDSGLLGSDQNPMSREMQNWDWKTLFFTAVGIAFNIVLIMQAAILILTGNNWLSVLVIMVLAGVLLGIFFGLSGGAGEKYGIPHTVLARAVFGNGWGTYLVTGLRGIVALFFFGIQSWIVAQCVDGILSILAGWEAMSSFPRLFVWFVLFIGVQYVLLFYGYKAFRYAALYGMPAAIIVLAIAVIWMYTQLGSWGPVWGMAPDFAQNGGASAFYLGLAMLFGSWATLIINFSDLTRMCKISSRQVMTATGSGYIIGMVIAALLGITTLSLSVEAGIGAEWNPVVWAANFPNALFAILILLLVFIAQITTNPQANMLAPAVALCNMAPRRISLRTASAVLSVVSIGTVPWVILQHQTTLFTYLANVGAVLAGAASIMLLEYWWGQKATLDVPALYKKEGRYRYVGGVNVAALLAVAGSMILGIVFIDQGGTFISGVAGVVLYGILRPFLGRQSAPSQLPELESEEPALN
jgi:nucleobase:cation symporter-1, NCS1 family